MYICRSGDILVCPNSRPLQSIPFIVVLKPVQTAGQNNGLYLYAGGFVIVGWIRYEECGCLSMVTKSVPQARPRLASTIRNSGALKVGWGTPSPLQCT